MHSTAGRFAGVLRSRRHRRDVAGSDATVWVLAVVDCLAAALPALDRADIVLTVDWHASALRAQDMSDAARRAEVEADAWRSLTHRRAFGGAPMTAH